MKYYTPEVTMRTQTYYVDFHYNDMPSDLGNEFVVGSTVELWQQIIRITRDVRNETELFSGMRVTSVDVRRATDFFGDPC
jgi:hypothetical protein